jgi:hypothetical protein
MERNKSRMTRITIEVAGYRWRVHGSKTGLIWHTHLVELLGAERLDVPLDQGLRQKIREAVGKQLDLEVADIRPITEDLVLV